MFQSCRATISQLASIIPENQFWRWKDLWVHSLRTAVFAVALVEYLKSRDLVSLQQVSDTLGCKELVIIMNLIQIKSLLNHSVKAEWADRITLPVEDYLLGLISLVNDLVRSLAVYVGTTGLIFSIFFISHVWQSIVLLLVILKSQSKFRFSPKTCLQDLRW